MKNDKNKQNVYKHIINVGEGNLSNSTIQWITLL